MFVVWIWSLICCFRFVSFVSVFWFPCFFVLLFSFDFGLWVMLRDGLCSSVSLGFGIWFCILGLLLYLCYFGLLCF